MTKDGERKNSSNGNDGLESLFSEADLISSYSSAEAVADGILFDVLELKKLSPGIRWEDGPFRYVTANLCYTKGYLKDEQEVSIPNFLDLFTAVGLHMQKTGPSDFYNTTVEFPDGTQGMVYAARNEHPGKYTIMLPEDN